MRSGYFPAKTEAYNKYALEAGLLMSKQGLFGEKKLQVPICDVAGEDIELGLISQYSSQRRQEAYASYSQAMTLIRSVKDAEGFIVTVPASKALFGERKQLEKESETAFFDPDVNLSRILEGILDYKQTSRGRKIKGLAVVITKWDILQPYAESKGMDIYTSQGLTEFMNVCFPDTTATIKSARLNNVHYFPSYVLIERYDDGTPRLWDKGYFPGTPKIVVNDRRIPSYAQQEYVNLVDYLLTFAT